MKPGAGAAALSALVWRPARVVVGVLVLALAPEDPCALSNDEEEGRADTPACVAAVLMVALLVLLVAVATKAA